MKVAAEPQTVLKVAAAQAAVAEAQVPAAPKAVALKAAVAADH
jgi:hypothetical protein